MKPTLQSIIRWTPRVFCLLFAAFISLFALDVFDGAHGFWRTAVALMMHLVPTAILLGLLALSWRWEWVGALAFPALGLLYLGTSWGRLHWSAYAVIAGPLLLLGALFYAAWRVRRAEGRRNTGGGKGHLPPASDALKPGT